MRRAFTIAALLTIAPPAAAELKPGAKAPDFTTTGALAGKPFRLHLAEQLKHGPLVLYFFPAAFTPGCNAEARAFAESIDSFRAAGARVVGMSADPLDRLRAFSTEHCAGRFPVATATPEVIRGYDVLLDRNIPGETRTLTSRTSYVISPDGRILYAFSGPNPTEHVRNTLAAVQGYRPR